MADFSAKHYMIKSEKNMIRAGEEADRAKSYADSLQPDTFVKTSGDQTIGGNKFFKDIVVVEKDFFCRATNITLGTAPSSSQYASYMINDKNDKQIANFYVNHTTANNILASMIATNINNSTGASFDSAIRVVATPRGERYTEAPATDRNNSIVTTVNKSKAANGYFKLGNGLIIQWGQRSAMSVDSELTITFPTAFTSTNYSFTDCAVLSGYSTNNRGGASIKSSTKTTTKVTLIQDLQGDNGGQWIAIGY